MVIKVGTTASSPESKLFDATVKIAAEQAAILSGLPFKKTLPKYESPGELSYSKADGPIIAHQHDVHYNLMATEAKFQQDDGNANNRLHELCNSIRHLSPTCSVLVFCAGEGALPDGNVFYRMAAKFFGIEGTTVDRSSLNKFHRGKTSFYLLNYDITSNELLALIEPAILEIKKNADKLYQDGLSRLSIPAKDQRERLKSGLIVPKKIKSANTSKRK